MEIKRLCRLFNNIFNYQKESRNYPDSLFSFLLSFIAQHKNVTPNRNIVPIRAIFMSSLRTKFLIIPTFIKRWAAPGIHNSIAKNDKTSLFIFCFYFVSFYSTNSLSLCNSILHILYDSLITFSLCYNYLYFYCQLNRLSDGWFFD